MSWMEARPEKITINGKEVTIPHMVLSVSSVETNLSPEEYTKILVASGVSSLLVSAYDVYKTISEGRHAFSDTIKSAKDAGVIVLMDSGNYEKDRFKDQSWNLFKFVGVNKSVEADAYFSFDNLNPVEDRLLISQNIIQCVKEDEARTSRVSRIQPIVHIPKGKINFLPEVCFDVAKALRPEVIAIPERELGKGIFDRANNLNAIRIKLNELDWYQPIHILGTGNPISMVILAAAGGDIFDGLEWCRTSIDHQTAKLHHTQHYDFLSWQTDFRDEDISYNLKLLSHNIEFYQNWNQVLPEMFSNNKVFGWLQEMNFLSKEIISDIKNSTTISEC